MRRRRAAFTLIELLVVMAIIGILAGMLFPIFGAMRTRAKITKAHHEAGQIDTAWKMYQLKERTLSSVQGMTAMDTANTWTNLAPYMETANLMVFSNGVPVDPWGSYYHVLLKQDDPERDIKVWSFGPNKKDDSSLINGGDDVRSW